MRRSYVYRLCPTVSQERRLDAVLFACRTLYNAALEQRRTAWSDHRRSLSLYEQKREVKHVKADPLLADLMVGVHTHVLQDALRRLDRAYVAFFRRIKTGEKPGHPRFKGRDRYDSFCFPEWGNGCALGGKRGAARRLRVSGCGSIRIRLHRPIPDGATIKTATIRRRGGHWYVALSVDLPSPTTRTAGRQVGVDVGLTALAVTSDGIIYPAPRFERIAARRTAHLARALARKKRGSANRADARRSLARHHERIANRRRDHAWKTARQIVSGASLVALEDLDARFVTRSRMARSAHDAAWNILRRAIVTKAEDAGCAVVLVDPRNTTRTCSGCGVVGPTKPLSQRTHRCAGCALEMDRDHNAARNIIRAGQALRGGQRNAAA